jgi:hypothetical protein
MRETGTDQQVAQLHDRLYDDDHTGTSEEITAGFVSVSHMYLKCNILKIL